MAAVLASPALGFAHRQSEAFGRDPWEWAGQFLVKAGVSFIVGGFAMGTAGYFLKASSTAAANNEKAILSDVGSVFSNIRAPSFTPAATGTAPVTASLAGVQNFFSDAWSDAKALASDASQIAGVMGTLGEDIADGIIDVGKAIFVSVTHFPDLLWNGMVYGVGGSFADLFNWLFPWLVIVGTVMLVLGLVINASRRIWNRVAAPAWNEASGKWLARREAKVQGFFDKLFHNPTPPHPIAGADAMAEEAEAGVGGRAAIPPPAFTETVPPAGPVEKAEERPTGPALTNLDEKGGVNERDFIGEQGSDGRIASVRGPSDAGISRVPLRQSSWSLGPAGDISESGSAPDRSNAGKEGSERTTGILQTPDGGVGRDSSSSSGRNPLSRPDGKLLDISGERTGRSDSGGGSNLSGVMTQVELEDHLGEVPNRAPTMEEMARMLVEAEANRKASMPRKPRVSGYEESKRAAELFAAAEAEGEAPPA